ncbi:hypothetical protein D3C87_1485080 [compost metagenome]
MFHQADNRHRIARPKCRFQQKLGQRSLRRAGKRRAGRIVGKDAEACKLRRHPPAKRTVGRDQRRLCRIAIAAGFLQRQPKRDGNRDCFLPLIGRLDQGDIGKGRTKRLDIRIVAPLAPAVGRLGRHQRLRDRSRPKRQIDWYLSDDPDIIPHGTDLLQQLGKPELRMAAAGGVGLAVERFLFDSRPLVIRHGCVEARKHDRAIRQAGDRRDQLCCRRHRARRSGNDHRPPMLSLTDPPCFASEDRGAMFGRGGTF